MAAASASLMGSTAPGMESTTAGSAESSARLLGTAAAAGAASSATNAATTATSAAARRRTFLMRRTHAALWATCWLLALATPAGAREATAEEVAALARSAAAGNESALQRLRDIDTVEGRAVDLESALDAAGTNLTSRLEMLTRTTSAPPPSDPQRTAQNILSERRFQDTDLPQPLREPLEALADRLRDIGAPFAGILDALPGEGSVEWVVLAIIVAALSGLVALRLARRRARLREKAFGRTMRVESLDPGSLEADADRAEAEGHLERALRLRFSAGLLRLDGRRVIRFTPSLTTGDVARRLGSPDFDRLASIFDEVVYGRRPPTRTDVEESRDGWTKVLTGARR
jgi:hypothetical protein